MIYLKTPDEIEAMRPAADLVSRTMGEVARWIAPGVTTRKLDTIAANSFATMVASLPAWATKASPGHFVSK